MTVIFNRLPAAPEPEDPPPPPMIEDEGERMRVWRTDRFEEIGLPYPLALELALSGVDWHRVKRAMDGGATVKDVEGVFL